QAEDGIRDFHVTGVQTCALPIYWLDGLFSGSRKLEIRPCRITRQIICPRQTNTHFGIAFTDTVVLTYPGNGRFAQHPRLANVGRSEERRVGKESRPRWERDQRRK